MLDDAGYESYPPPVRSAEVEYDCMPVEFEWRFGELRRGNAEFP